MESVEFQVHASRGMLVADFLRNDITAVDYLESLRSIRSEYFGYNLVVGSSSELLHYSNVTNNITELNEGFHGLSNADLNTPWPKVIKGLSAIKEKASYRLEHQDIFEIMTCKEKAPDHLLPSTGVSIERERDLSSLFVHTPTYGTKCTSLLILYQDGRCSFREKSYKRASTEVEESIEVEWRREY